MATVSSMRRVIVLRNYEEVFYNQDALQGTALFSATGFPVFYGMTEAAEILVEELAAEVPGGMESIRRYAKRHPGSSIHILPMEDIRLAFGSAHERLRFAAMLMKREVVA